MDPKIGIGDWINNATVTESAAVGPGKTAAATMLKTLATLVEGVREGRIKPNQVAMIMKQIQAKMGAVPQLSARGHAPMDGALQAAITRSGGAAPFPQAAAKIAPEAAQDALSAFTAARSAAPAPTAAGGLGFKSFLKTLLGGGAIGAAGGYAASQMGDEDGDEESGLPPGAELMMASHAKGAKPRMQSNGMPRKRPLDLSGILAATSGVPEGLGSEEETPMDGYAGEEILTGRNPTAGKNFYETQTSEQSMLGPGPRQSLGGKKKKNLLRAILGGLMTQVND
jgi:hypothetical protein